MGRGVLVLAFASFAVGTQAFVFAGLLAFMAADLGVGVGMAGQLASAFALTFAVTAPFVATILGPFDRKRIILAGLGVLGALNLLAALAPSFALLMALRVGCGLAATLVIPMASAAAAQLAPPHLRGRALAVVLAGTTLAFVFGIPTGSFLGGVYGWRASFAYAGVLALAAGAIIAVVLPSVPPVGGVRPPFRDALRARVLRPVTLTLAAFAATFSVVAYVGPIVSLTTGVEGSGVGLFQMLVGFGSLAGVVLGGRLADGPHRARAATLMFAVMVVTLSAYSLLVWRGPSAAGNGVLLSTVMIVGAGALFALSPIIQSAVVEAAPDSAPVALALNGSAIFLGQGLGAAIGGALIGLAGYAALGLAGGAIAAGAALLATSSLGTRVAAPSVVPQPRGSS